MAKNAFKPGCRETIVETDEMWSFYHYKKHQVWVWRAVEHRTNTPMRKHRYTKRNEFYRE